MVTYIDLPDILLDQWMISIVELVASNSRKTGRDEATRLRRLNGQRPDCNLDYRVPGVG